MIPYVSFESLLVTNRAVKRKGSWIRIHTAGNSPDVFWLEFDNKNTARLAGYSILQHIREKKADNKCYTDAMYNRLLYDWFEQLRNGGYIKNSS